MNTLASVLERHRERTQALALVAPLGGGAMVALQALHHAPAAAAAWPPVGRRPRRSPAIGIVAAALALCLGLAGTSGREPGAVAPPARSEAAVRTDPATV